MNQIQLGQKVKCKITGFTGIVTVLTKYPFQVDRAQVQPPTDKDGKPMDSYDIDVTALDVVESKPIAEPTHPSARFEFGQKARDPFTGYEGKIYGRACHINGCVTIALQPEHDKKKEKYSAGVWYPEQQIEPVGKVLKTKKEPVFTGGPANKFESSRP